jgi:hypothetical protein
VIDLYERGSGVRNEDIVTCNLGMYDTGICISTLEHIPETEGRTGQDSIIALRRLQAQCTSLFVSVPCGYNDRLESAVASELGMAWAYRRVSHAAWEQVEPKDVIGSTRSGFVRGADAVVIGASRRDFGGQDKSEDIARNDVQ